MIRSMTGYGWAQGHCRAGSARVEVHTVNYKDFKFTPRLPDFLRYKEGELEKIARSFVKRGHLYANVDADISTELIGKLLDRPKMKSYIDAARDAVGDAVNVTAEISGLLALPGVLDLDSLPEDMREEIYRAVSEAFRNALTTLDGMRLDEGKGLKNHLLSLCEAMQQRIKSLSVSLPDAILAYQKRLKDRIGELMGDLERPDDGVLSREISIIAERSDVAEELERLRNHLEQFRRALGGKERGAGKKMEFLAQEMHREANTLASKLPSAELIHSALDIKTDVYQMREQVMNVE